MHTSFHPMVCGVLYVVFFEIYMGPVSQPQDVIEWSAWLLWEDFGESCEGGLSSGLDGEDPRSQDLSRYVSIYAYIFLLI